MFRSVLLVVSLLAAVAVQPSAALQGPVISRVASDTDPVLAATQLTGLMPDGQAEYVVLGRDDVFADNLAATALTGPDRPLLLTTGGADAFLRPEVLAELDRLLDPSDGGCGAARVYIVGGSAAVSTAVEVELDAANYCVTRLAAGERVGTSVAVARERVRLGALSRVIVARSDDWADAATAGAIAADQQIPIIVTPTAGLAPAAAAFIAETSPRIGIVMGGTAALSATVYDQVAALTPETWRVSGPTREETAVSVMNELWYGRGTTVERALGVALVNGRAETGWAYAFAAAWLSAVRDLPQLYTTAQGVPSAPTLLGLAGTSTIGDVVGLGPASDVTDAGLSQASRAVQDGGPRFRVVYVHATDASPNVDYVAATGPTVEQAANWFLLQSGRTLRIDRSADGSVALPVVDLGLTQAQLDAPGGSFGAVLQAVPRGPEDVVVAFVQGGQAGLAGCGRFEDGDRGPYIQLPFTQCERAPDTGPFPFGNLTYVTAHEMVHALGAVPECAPHYADMHVDDSPSDILYRGSLPQDFDSVTLDVGRDDYFAHGRSDCLDIADSPMLE